jgi:hypothetical protein
VSKRLDEVTMLVPWQKDFELGRPAADAEHREVVDLLNELDVCLADDTPGDDIDRALTELGDLLAHHLEREQAMEAQVVDSLRRLSQGQNRSDLRALAYWWLNHLCRHHGIAV